MLRVGTFPAVVFAPVPLPELDPGGPLGEIRGALVEWVLSPPVRALADACGWPIDDGAPPQQVLDDLASRTDAWDFRGRRERDQISDADVVVDGRPLDAGLVVDAARALGLVDATPSPGRAVHHVLVLSGLARACINRCRLAADLLVGGLRAGRVSVLAANRDLSSGEQALAADLGLSSAGGEADVALAGAVRAFGLGAADDRRGSAAEEAGESWAAWSWTTWATSASGVPVDLVVAPSSDPSARRANTADQLAFWHERTPTTPGERLLLVTSQIYVPYQYLVAVGSLGLVRGCSIDVEGVDADRAELAMREFGARDYLQEIRSALRAAATLHRELGRP